MGEYRSEYFKSEACEKIFYLVCMTGEAKTLALGITRRHFAEEEKAREWRDSFLKVIHPDVCEHPKAHEAACEVERIYQEMIAR